MSRDRLTIIHIDMDAFFAAIEQQANPGLKGKPVIVCGDPDGRGVVSTASYEARMFGVRSAMPVREAKRLCPHAVLIRARHSLYGQVSNRLLEVYRKYTPTVEPFSIDEAFLDVAGCERLHGDAHEIAQKIKTEVREGFGLSCSVGIAPCKLLAKMASDMKKPDGLTVIRSEDIADIIWPLPVRKLYGVGGKTSQALESLGIRTVGALAKIPIELLTEKFGETGRLLSNIASGIDNSRVNPSIWEMPKSIGHETTLTEDSGNEAFILTCILSLSQQVGRRLRQQELVARTVTLKLRYSDFTTLTRANTFSFFTCLDEDIYQTAKGLFLCHWNRARKIRLVGVTVSNLSSKDDFMRQLALFEEDEKRRRATAAMDKVRDRFGENAITRASLVKPGKRLKKREAERTEGGCGV
ncbi:MAG TPA: DNA polymerase IV [Firmicutes bacterium]|jgi:DNA polymerase-4|nr:DNA polymerase IV [Bacillota bacterium]